MNLEPNILKDIILTTTKPLIIKNQLNWAILNWKLDDWRKVLENEKLQCRCGKNAFTREPQWERTTNTISTTFDDFIKFASDNQEEWLYFDYKYLKDWFLSNDRLRNAINWSRFGFSELTPEDATIWIGTKGAHTPCHLDTYGCNIIAQIYGKKEWLIFPPDENLKPTRVPYEESSIYSKLNFFSPYLDDFHYTSNCRRIILEAGDVLIMPNKWWHYVENLQTAISINVWLPLPQDDEQRLSESVVQMFFSQFCKDVDSDVRSTLLNPNSDFDITTNNMERSVDLIESCKNICKNKEKNQTTNQQKKIENSCLSAVKDCSYIENIPKLSINEFRDCIQQRAERFEQILDNYNNNYSKFVDIFDACTHPNVISQITAQLLNTI